MNRSLTVGLVVLAGITGILGCGPTEEAKQASLVKTPPPLATKVGEYQLLAPIDAGSVQLIPITMVSNPVLPKDQAQGLREDIITLAEAKKLGTVKITEDEGENEVNALKVTNTGTKAILLMGGDLLIGGHQDRIVAHDVLIPPGKTISVEVFCVEQGRWSGPTEHFEYNDTVVPDKVRKAAYKGQSEVWSEVDGYNGRAGFSAGSITVAQGMGSKKVQELIGTNLAKVKSELDKNPNVIGVMFVLNGKVQTMDLFGSPKFFASARDSILKGYLAEGATVAKNPSSQLKMEEAQDFIREMMRGRRKGRTADGDTKEAFRVRDGGTIGFEVQAPSASGKGGAAAAPLIHGNYSKEK